MSRSGRRVVLFAGGVGGARLASPLARQLEDGDALAIVVNVGDDFEHLGLAISPDLDTVLYHLSGLADAERGWGIAGDTFRAMEEMRALGGPAWFALGDRDLATHLYRSERLRAGKPLSEIARELAAARGVRAAIRLLPVTDDRVRTIVHTDAGRLGFQNYLVERQARDRVLRFEYEGAADAVAAPGVVELIERATHLLFAPSNPYVSILPMLAVPGIAPAIAASAGIRIAASPLIGGKAVKGPLVAMLESLGREATAFDALEATGLPIDVAFLDPADGGEAERFGRAGIATHVMPLLLRGTAADDVARAMLNHRRPAV